MALSQFCRILTMILIFLFKFAVLMTIFIFASHLIPSYPIEVVLETEFENFSFYLGEDFPQALKVFNYYINHAQVFTEIATDFNFQEYLILSLMRIRLGIIYLGKDLIILTFLSFAVAHELKKVKVTFLQTPLYLRITSLIGYEYLFITMIFLIYIPLFAVAVYIIIGSILSAIFLGLKLGSRF